MDDALTDLFNNFDRGTISRRQLFQALGLAAIAAPIASAFGQGSCGGANAGTARCDTMPLKAPFEPTGWKTTYMDHFSLQCVDYKREAAYYATLMNWRVRNDDGTQVTLDIGDDVGSVVIRGGLAVPPPIAPPPTPPPGDSAAAAGRGRGGGRGGGNRTPRHAVWESFAWGIDRWDKKKVGEELTKRGLAPAFVDDGRGYEAYAVKDPGGFTLHITNGNRKNRRQGAPKGNLPATAPFEPTNWKTVWLDHISFQCPNYKESTAFYSALLGWTPTGDEGSQNECMIGEVGNIIIRGGNPATGGGRAGGGGGAAGDSSGGRGGQAAPPRRMASIDHISFGISPWDTDAVKAELDKRGLSNSPDTGGRLDIHDPAAKYKSYHTTTPDGFNLQISNATKDTRKVR